MSPGFLLRQSAAVPVRHLFVALGIGAALGAGFWYWSLHQPVDYVSTALLSYESPHRFLADSAPAEAETPTVRIADSILSPAVLRRLADQVRFAADAPAQASGNASGNAASGDFQSGDARVESFRSHFDLAQPAPGLLQVTFRGQDAKQVPAATNALAGALAAWVAQPPSAAANGHGAGMVPLSASAAPSNKVASPLEAVRAPAPQPPTAMRVTGPAQDGKRAAAELQRRATVLDEDVATLELQRHGIDRQIGERAGEEKDLENALPRAAASPSADRTRLAAVVKELARLRLLHGSLVTDEESEKKQAQSLRARAAVLRNSPAPVEAAAPAAPRLPVPPAARPANRLPAPSSAAPSPAATEQPQWQGSFTVIAWGEKPIPVGDERKVTMLWFGGAAAIVGALIYLVLIAWRFRPVSDLAALRRALPGGAKYFGAVAGGPLAEKSS
jgi:hypothetical protein